MLAVLERQPGVYVCFVGLRKCVIWANEGARKGKPGFACGDWTGGGGAWLPSVLGRY